MRISINGQLGRGVTAKDVALYLMAQLTTSGATGYFVEYSGDVVRNLSMEGRLTLCNLSIEMGARGGFIAPDEITFNYVKGKEFAPKGKDWDKAVSYWRTLKSGDDAVFDKELVFNAADIEPRITYGTNPGMGIGITENIPAPQSSPEGDTNVLQSIEAPSGAVGGGLPLGGPWTLSFIEEAPRVDKTFNLAALQTWEKLDDDSVKVTMGTGVYTTHVKLTEKDLKDVEGWQIDLGDVRESARVYINNVYIGCAWSVPFVLDCRQALRSGDNEIRIEVTNLPANRIADLDRRGVQWRKMEEINVVDINYKKTLYDQWEPMPSGLNSDVKLVRYR
jgi:homoaconitase/3-isopropylmalate dehydratase large subunit